MKDSRAVMPPRIKLQAWRCKRTFIATEPFPDDHNPHILVEQSWPVVIGTIQLMPVTEIYNRDYWERVPSMDVHEIDG